MISSIPTEELAHIYQRMVQIRKFEDKTYSLFLEGLIPRTLHHYQGQEAVAVGACANLSGQDFIATTPIAVILD